MWNQYRRRHLWLFQVFSLFSSFYDYVKDQQQLIDPTNGTPIDTHGRHLLEIPPVNDIVLNCVPPSIEEFPDDFFSQEQRIKGGLIVHVLIVAYVCSMLAIVCDRYFVPSLGVIASYFNVSSDIAGATFMAIGTSSPELFSSVIGAFLTEGDIGVGTVVGSAVFNILAVTGASGLAVGAAVVQLDWYPISRDCFMYIITISSLVFVIHDNVVTWIEATCLLLMFAGYLLILYLNEHVKKYTTEMVESVHSWWVSRKSDDLLKLPQTIIDETTPLIIDRVPVRYVSYDDSACPSSGSASLQGSTGSGSETLAQESGQYEPIVVSTEYYGPSEKSLSESALVPPGKVLEESKFEESSEVSVWKIPAGMVPKLLWLLMWPANFLFLITIPNCSNEKGKKWFPLTFAASVFWLGILSYMSFWMVAVIGYTLGIPDTVSGLTILAAGTSVPELVASVIVVRNGLGNMALCNLVGSNIFDILFCLGAPWLIKSAINTETRSLVINSSAMTYTTLILLSTVVLFYISLVVCRWRLSWRTGIIALFLYVSFLVLASLYETNIFGDFNPPSCATS